MGSGMILDFLLYVIPSFLAGALAVALLHERRKTPPAPEQPEGPRRAARAERIAARKAERRATRAERRA